jgi:hypothetical protein
MMRAARTLAIVTAGAALAGCGPLPEAAPQAAVGQPDQARDGREAGLTGRGNEGLDGSGGSAVRNSGNTEHSRAYLLQA